MRRAEVHRNLDADVRDRSAHSRASCPAPSQGYISAVMCGLVGPCSVGRNVGFARTPPSFLTGLFASVHPLYPTARRFGHARRY